MLLYPDDGESALVIDAVRAQEEAVRDVLEKASACGTVIIVTLSEAGWVDKSTTQFMPGLKKFLQDSEIEVVYARDAFSQRQMRAAKADAANIWHLMKAAAMRKVIQRFYSRKKAQSWKNIIGIGDSIVEWNALLEVALLHSQTDRHGIEKALRCKTVKLQERLGLDELTEELQIIAGWIEPLANFDGELSINLDNMDEAVVALRSLLVTSPATSPRHCAMPLVHAFGERFALDASES